MKKEKMHPTTYNLILLIIMIACLILSLGIVILHNNKDESIETPDKMTLTLQNGNSVEVITDVKYFEFGPVYLRVFFQNGGDVEITHRSTTISLSKNNEVIAKLITGLNEF